MRAVLSVCLLSLALVGCASGEGTPNRNPSPEIIEFKDPSLVTVAPGKLALGDNVQVVGRDFLKPQYGTLHLHLSGTFTAANGGTNDWEGDIPITYKNAGLAEFEFGPNVIFAPRGDAIGTFNGTATVIAHLTSTGEEKRSNDVQVGMQVQPSIVLDQLRSVDANCRGLTRSTISGTNLALGVRAIGIESASEVAPIVFRVHYVAPQLTVKFVNNQTFDSWPVPDMPSYVGNAQPGANFFEMKVTTGSSAFFDPKSREQLVQINPPVMIGQDTRSEAKLARLQTGPVGGVGGQDIILFVEAIKAGGGVAKRNVTLRVFQEGEIQPYDGRSKIVEVQSPEPTTGCLPGGDFGTDVTYYENESASRSRTLTFNWNVMAGESVGINVGAWGQAYFNLFGLNYNKNWSSTFGTDASETVTSEMSMGKNITKHIVPGYFGVSYRQATRLEKSVNVIYHNPCGASAVVGKVILTDWKFGYDIGTGPQCDDKAMPPSSLPKPFKIVD